MSILDEFLDDIEIINSERNGDCTIEQSQRVVKIINEFLYSEYSGPEKIEAFGRSFAYFSAFHKYWNDNHEKILNARISDSACSEVAEILHNEFINSKGMSFTTVYNTGRLKPEEICRIRFLTANQDFRGSRDFGELIKIYRKKKTIFDEEYIKTQPEEFLKNLNISKLSQTDKRPLFAQKACDFILEKNTTPYGLIDYYEHDVSRLRKELISFGAGYGNKKTDMFIRDMVVLRVWEDVRGFDEVDVASDINTIKIALRTGILQTDIPLVSSFLDIFGNQYSYIDRMNAKAWRRVWELWDKKYPNEISSPCLIDYFIYNKVGRELCKQRSYFLCEKGHLFEGNANIKYCKECNSKKQKVLAKKVLVGKPCEVDPQVYNGESLFEECPFKLICDKNGKKDLNPPSSISITGNTGWEKAYSKPGQGGGGIMS